MYHKKLLKRWATIYIEKARAEGNVKAKQWANGFLPKEAVPEVKKLVELELGINRN